MSVNIYHSRRTNYRKCIYWNRDERDSIANSSKWIANNKPDGSFFGRPVSNKTTMNNPVNNVMMFDRNSITLETDDDIDNIQVNSIVKYNNSVWILENIQAIPHIKEMAFSTRTHYKYILTLRR